MDVATILYFVPFLYMYACFIKLAYRKDRGSDNRAVLVRGGKIGVWLLGLLAFVITLCSMVLAVIPTSDVVNKAGFVMKIVGSTIVSIGIGLALYWRGARTKAKV
ncbi:MAG TPA: hypothetical protein VJW55_17640 [Candidatus Angelobacter sp.]|nr:hypothetical protein [Candidatus Angelobacter sp.]